jgi:hypothetical protein
VLIEHGALLALPPLIAAVAFFVFELIAHGRPSPPSVERARPDRGGMRKKPTFVSLARRSSR